MTDSPVNIVTVMGMDAQAWAKEFCSLNDHCTVDGEAADDCSHSVNLGTMIGWFANAIMMGYDRGRLLGQKEGVEALVGELQRTVTGNED